MRVASNTPLSVTVSYSYLVDFGLAEVEEFE